MRNVVIAIVLIIFAVLGYGYWHIRTHAYFSISLYDASGSDRSLLFRNARITLRDSNNTVLATGKSEKQYGSVVLSHPETGPCYDPDQITVLTGQALEAWRECFEIHSKWMSKWADSLTNVDIEIDDCRLNNVPVQPRLYRESWLLWWIPHPHIGGKPYSYYSFLLRIDPVACRLVE